MRRDGRRGGWVTPILATIAVVATAATGAALAAGVPVPLQATGRAGEEWPVTRAERTAYAETSRYDEVVEFIDNVAHRAANLHTTRMGYTNEGRALPLVVVTNLEDPTPERVAASGRLRVYLQGNIHAGEVCGKEALLMLLRQLAQGENAAWLDELVLLVAPIYNADGNERVDLANRPGQNGPVGGMGQRPNAQGLDLNRDHIKLESPEARSLVRLLNTWDPEVGVDLHTTNGTRHAYHLTYAPPLHPNTHPAIDGLLRDAWLPTVTDRLRQRTGWETYHYGNLPFGRGAERGWYTFDHRPRFNNNYLGLRNRVAILSEAYAYASFEERVVATLEFVEEILEYAAANADSIRAAVATADATPLPGTELAVRAAPRRSARPVEILLGDVEVTAHPLTGRRVAVRTNDRTPETMPEYIGFAASESSTVPAAYLVPADLSPVIDRLRAHGVDLEALSAEADLAVERFRIDASTEAPREFQGHRERTLEGAWEVATVSVAAGTLRVDMAQPLGRLAFSLLEPRSDDGVANWNLVDEALAGAAFYPILRLAADRRP